MKVEGELDYVTIGDERCRSDDVNAVERALRRWHEHDDAKVSDDLAAMSLVFAKCGAVAAASRFLARAGETSTKSGYEGRRFGNIAMGFVSRGRDELAAESFEMARHLPCGEPESTYLCPMLISYAACLNRLGRHVEAESISGEAIRIDPRRRQGYMECGIALMGQGRIDEAVVILRHEHDLRPNDRMVAQYLAIAEERIAGERSKPTTR